MYSHIKIINLIPYVHIDTRDLLESKSLILNKKYNIDNNFCHLNRALLYAHQFPILHMIIAFCCCCFFFREINFTRKTYKCTFRSKKAFPKMGVYFFPYHTVGRLHKYVICSCSTCTIVIFIP